MDEISIIVSTGDISSKPLNVCKLRLAIDRPLTEVSFDFDNEYAGRLASDDWPELIEQVGNKELVKRYDPKELRPPLGKPDFVPFLAGLSSTPRYQLFLAALDIAERVNLASDLPYREVKKRFGLLDRQLPSYTGGGVFFIPEMLLQDKPPANIDELIRNNKICSASLSAESDPTPITRYYVPYATPTGFIIKASKEASSIWDEIRNYHYAFKHAM